MKTDRFLSSFRSDFSDKGLSEDEEIYAKGLGGMSFALACGMA